MHTQLSGLLTTGLLLLAMLPASASAASVNSRSALSALGAYKTYLSNTLSNLTSTSNKTNAVVANVQANCPSALSSLNNVTAGKKVQAAVTDFGHEVDADVSLSSLSNFKSALTGLGSVLDSLEWSTPTQSSTTSRLISSEKTLFGLKQSSLCADAYRLAGHPSSVPPGTTSFLLRYDRAHSALVNAENAFGSLLSRNAPSSGQSLLSQDQELESQFTSTSTTAEQSAANDVLTALGFS